MPLVSRVRPRVGDVIEIPTPQGLAYAHFTHKHGDFGALLRVLPGLYPHRPSDFSELVAHKPLFSTFFPLGAACGRKIVSVVASETIPKQSQQFPIFRRAFGSSSPWILWDGDREWQTPTLSQRQLEDYPPLVITNDTLLVDRIISGWRHELHRGAA